MTDPWPACIHAWLTSLERRSGARHTRAAYANDLRTFTAAFPELSLSDVTPTHAERWAEQMNQSGLAKATINRRLAALSSLYRYASTDYLIGDQPLWSRPNPFASRNLRHRIPPYGRTHYPTAGQVTSLLSQIDTSTPTGLRNLAIIAGLFMTARRVSEWLTLRGRAIHATQTGHRWIEYRVKGGGIGHQLLPPALWRIIEHYLTSTGRTLADDDYLFVALSPNGARLPTTRNPQPANPQPLSDTYVNQLIRRYGRAAAIPDACLHAHALRHAGARWRKDHGQLEDEIQGILGHADLRTTHIYTHTVLAEPIDTLADQVGLVLPPAVHHLLRG